MKLVQELAKESARSTATVIAATAVGVGIYEGCGYMKDTALRFFDAHCESSAKEPSVNSVTTEFSNTKRV